MASGNYLFTSESVSMGHPDKVSDQISDAIVDDILANDENPGDARVAVETLCTTGQVVVAGEVRTSHYVRRAEGGPRDDQENRLHRPVDRFQPRLRRLECYSRTVGRHRSGRR